jgi:hypothetical protein
MVLGNAEKADCADERRVAWGEERHGLRPAKLAADRDFETRASRTESVRRRTMENISSTKRNPDRQHDLPPSFGTAMRQIDLTTLLEENKQLRELVIQLSKMVIKNAVDHK